MLTERIGRILTRDLLGLRRQLLAYPTEDDIWRSGGSIANSAGTLVLHAAGNLQHFLGAQLGGTGYRRNRDAEFARRGVPRAELLAEIDRASAAVQTAFGRLTDADLQRPYPLELAGRCLTVGEFLVHLSAHLAYHSGQIDYHRRLIGGGEGQVDMVPLGVLGTGADS